MIGGRRHAFSVAAFAALLCVGCSERLPPCPAVKIQSPLAQVSRFVPGAERDSSNMQFQVEITDIALKCEYSDLKVYTADTGSGQADVMEVRMRVYFTAVPGPAGGVTDVDLEYFILVTDLRDNVLQKREFPARISIAPNNRPTVTREDAWLLFDLDGRSGSAFKIFTGFQLNDEQRRYNELQISY